MSAATIEQIVRVEAIGADDFDMDLAALCPDIAACQIAKSARRLPVYVFGAVSEQSGRPCLTHPATWNSCGVPVFFSPPLVPRNARGWVSLCGHVTRDPLVELSWFDFVRDLWTRSSVATLGGIEGRRVLGPSYHRLFSPLMAQVRVWRDPDPDLLRHLLEKARNWALGVLAFGLECAAIEATPKRNDDAT